MVLEVLQPEIAQARFDNAIASLHSTFVTHTQEPLRTFTGADFLQQFGPWSSAAICIEACGFHAISELETEADLGIPLLEAAPEPEPDPEPTPALESAPEPASAPDPDTESMQDVPPGLSALIAMELGDPGQCTKAFEFADGDVETAIQVLLSGDIPPSDPAPAPAPATTAAP
eukprot:COSAG02_NODE_13504_length_1386_cov_0.876457_1_plen_172_part_10